MDNKLLESYLETILELVIDEGKIVTYKSLSRNLGVHINTAKQLLYAFLVKQKDEGTCPVSATYLLAGKFDDGSLNVTVINESDLKSTHEKFAEVTSQHLYSVQKGNELKDMKVLAGIGKGAQSFESAKVVIKCSKSCMKSRVEKEEVRTPETNTVILTSVQNTQIKNEGVQKIQKTENGGPSGKAESLSECGNQIAMKSPVKKSCLDVKSKTQSPTKASLDKKSASFKTRKPTQNIANFFTNTTQKNSERKPVVIETINGVSSNQERVNSTVDRFDENEMSVLYDNGPPIMTNFKRNKSKESLKKKKGGSKRKRIQVFSDSEESDSGNGEQATVQKEEEYYDKVKEEEEDESTKPLIALLEEEKECVKEMPQNKHKKRKIVDRTVMNEDGYLETKKEIVFETDSENELVLEALDKSDSSNHQQKKVKTDEGEEKSKSLPSSNASKKQSSLLAFFKKN